MSKPQAQTSPNKNLKTRMVYKNIKDDDSNDPRSLYAVTYGKTAEKMNQAPASTSKPTLADIGNLKRPSSSRSSANGSRLAQTPKSLTGSRNSARRPMSGQKAKSGHQCKTAVELLNEFMQKTSGRKSPSHIDIEAAKEIDVCPRCLPEKQRFYATIMKVNPKLTGSLYQKDYVKHPLDDQGPTLKNDFYTGYKNDAPMNFDTNHKNQYKDWNVGPVKKETMNWKPATTGIPFAGKSQYRSEYANWGANITAYEKASQALTVIPELRFQSKTTSHETFCMPEATEQLKPKDMDLWNKTKKSPITAPIPFLGESTNKAAYKAYKVEPTPKIEREHEYTPTPSIPEHHRSNYKKDFAPKDAPVCDAILFMEENLHPRYKHLYAYR